MNFPKINLGPVIGQGYNILTDKSVAEVMKFNDVAINYGIAIPACTKFEKVQQSRSFMEEFKDETSYTQSRLKNLNVNLAVKPDIFKMDCRAGYNKKSNSTTSSCTSKYSFLFEQRLFELKIDNCKDCLNNGMTFTENFKSEVMELPSKYNKKKYSCVSKFREFYNRFGHFFASSAYGGGSVEVKCSKEAVGSTGMSLADTKVFLAAKFEGLGKAKENLSAEGSAFESLLKQSTYFWKGGEAALQTNETIGDKERLQKWKNSLILNPTMLTSELRLEPISTAVGCIDGQKEQATYDALMDLLLPEIKFRAKKEKKEFLKETMARMIEAITRKGSLMEQDHKDIEDNEIERKKMANLDVGDKDIWTE